MPTQILNYGTKIASSGSTATWVAECPVNGAVSWPAAGAKNVQVDASDTWSQTLGSATSVLTTGSFLPDMTVAQASGYSAKFLRERKAEIQLTDTSGTRGLRCGYAIKIESQTFDLSVSGDPDADVTIEGDDATYSPIGFKFPASLDFLVTADFYIKTSCDIANSFAERNVAHVAQSVTVQAGIQRKMLSAAISTETVDTVDYVYCRLQNIGPLDTEFAKYQTSFWERVTNFDFAESSWQKWPLFGDVKLRVVKRDSNLKMHLLGQYPVLEWDDPFVNRILAVNAYSGTTIDSTTAL